MEDTFSKDISPDGILIEFDDSKGISREMLNALMIKLDLQTEEQVIHLALRWLSNQLQDSSSNSEAILAEMMSRVTPENMHDLIKL